MCYIFLLWLIKSWLQLNTKRQICSSNYLNWLASSKKKPSFPYRLWSTSHGGVDTFQKGLQKVWGINLGTESWLPQWIYGCVSALEYLFGFYLFHRKPTSLAHRDRSFVISELLRDWLAPLLPAFHNESCMKSLTVINWRPLYRIAHLVKMTAIKWHMDELDIH